MNKALCARLDDFLEQRLAPEERAEFVRHLAACSSCLDAVRAQQRLDVLFPKISSTTGTIPPDFISTFQLGTHQELRARDSHSPAFRGDYGESLGRFDGSGSRH